MGTVFNQFMGAKLALFVGEHLAVIQRDDRPGLLWPGYWDVPGGGRERTESPLACALRETHEELGVRVPVAQVRWGRPYTNSIGCCVWFFAAWQPQAVQARIVLGSEGQRWTFMRPPEFIAHDKAVPQFKDRLQDYLVGVPSYAGFSRFI